jgi:predicted Holliday junction resolvase-like endonuclease
MNRKYLGKLLADPNVMAECECGEVFPLKDAIIFNIKDPLPEEAKEKIDEIKSDISERSNILKESKKRMKDLIPKVTEAVNRGKILEKIAPAYSEVRYELQDYRTLFEPIDYIVFDGLTRKGKIDSIKFIDCKTGSAGLNKHQREIKDVVEKGKLFFETYKG